MQTISVDYKHQLKKLGRKIRAKIWVFNGYQISTENDNNLITENNLELITEQINRADYVEITGEDIFSIDLINSGDILKSLMKQCNINIKQDLEIGRKIEIIFELLIDEQNNIWELVDYGIFIIYSKEYNFDTKSWNYTCYDEMLYAMKDYKLLDITYPITVKYFIDAIANRMGLSFANITGQFTNYSELIYEDPYKNVDVTYRDVLDDLSEIVGGNIWVNRYSQLEVKYPTTTYLYEYQLIDFNSLTIPYPNKLSSKFENDTLTLTKSGNNAYCYQDITMIYKRNGGKTLRFDFDSIQQEQSFTGDIVKLITTDTNLTMRVYTLLTRDKQIYNHTIPVNTFDIIKANIYIYTSVTSDTSTGTMIIEKPYLHFGANKEEYVPLTNDILDKNYLKDVNVYFGKKIGPFNKITIEDKDKEINYTTTINSSIEKNGENELIISNNPIISSDNYQTIATNILDRLKDLQYYANNITTIGLGYYELLDLFNVNYENKIYPCLLLNSEINITTGLEENIYTSETTNASKDYSSRKQNNNVVAETIRAKGNAYANGYKLVQENELESSTQNILSKFGGVCLKSGAGRTTATITSVNGYGIVLIVSSQFVCVLELTLTNVVIHDIYGTHGTMSVSISNNIVSVTGLYNWDHYIFIGSDGLTIE